MMLRAELLKVSGLASTKITVAVGVIGLLLTQLSFVLPLPALPALIGESAGAEMGGALVDELGAFDAGAASYQYDALSLFGSNGAGSIGLSMVAILALGLLIGTTDFRFGGIVSAALAQPRRGRIMAAKLGATAVWAVGLSVIYAAVCALVLGASLALTPGSELVLSFGDIVGTLVRGMLAMTMLAFLGLALGTILRGQLAGFLVLISVIVLDPLVRIFAQLIAGHSPLWTQFLPVALAQNSVAADGTASGLDPLLALLSLAVLTAAALAGAWNALSRRDI